MKKGKGLTTKSAKNLVIGNIGKCECHIAKERRKLKKPTNAFASAFKGKKKGTWAAPEEEGMPRKKKPSEGNLYVDVSNWF